MLAAWSLWKSLLRSASFLLLLRFSGKALSGLLLQQEGMKRSNSFPCLLFLGWQGESYPGQN